MSEDVLVTRDLTKRYGSHAAVQSMNLRLQRGRVYGLIGRNGAGKTTLMRLISGLSIPSSGGITLFGSGVETLGSRTSRASAPSSSRPPCTVR